MDPDIEEFDEDEIYDDELEEDLVEMPLKTDKLVRVFVNDVTEYERKNELQLPIISRPILNKFERARLVGVRASQLQDGAPPMVDIGSERDYIKIALMELEAEIMPLQLKRYIPGRDVHKPAYEIMTLADLM